MIRHINKDYRFWNDFAKMMGWRLGGYIYDKWAGFYTSEYSMGSNGYLQLSRAQCEDIIKVARGNHLPSCDFSCSCAWADVSSPKSPSKVCPICRRPGHSRYECPDQLSFGDTK